MSENRGGGGFFDTHCSTANVLDALVPQILVVVSYTVSQ